MVLLIAANSNFTYQRLADAGKLPVGGKCCLLQVRLGRLFRLQIRLYLMGYVESDTYWGNKITHLINYGKHSRLNLRSVKLFIDGQSVFLIVVIITA
jgi:hypothetical protein